MLLNTAPFRKKVADKTVKIGVFGISRSSLDFAVGNAVMGFHCTCIDSDSTLVNAIGNAANPFRRGGDNGLVRMIKKGRISGTDDFNVIGNLDMVLIGRSEGFSNPLFEDSRKGNLRPHQSRLRRASRLIGLYVG